MPDILHELRGQVAWTTLNRPQSRNAMTFAMYEGLVEQAAAVAADPRVRAWVITGAGGRAFAAGTDISQFTEFKTGQDALAYEKRIDRVLSAIEDCPKPVIAAVAGACTGGGLGIAGVCDLRIASTNARFGVPVAKTLGNCLSMANYARFSALIGPARLKEIVFTARLVEAPEALSIGLVSEVLETPEALEVRAQLVALCCVSDPRLAWVDLLDAAERSGSDGRGLTPHAAGYQRVLQQLLARLKLSGPAFTNLAAHV